MSEPWRKTEEAIFRDIARRDRPKKKKHKRKYGQIIKPKTQVVHY